VRPARSVRSVMFRDRPWDPSGDSGRRVRVGTPFSFLPQIGGVNWQLVAVFNETRMSPEERLFRDG
jgi:hypothetical protein